MNDYILGIDIGTTGCKSVVYNINGRKIESAYKEYTLSYPKPNWAEINPNIWWKSVISTIKKILNKNISSKNIKSIGISCTNALVSVDKNGKVLRNAIMQIDQRTNEEMDWIKENINENSLFEITGNRVAPGTFSAPIILWLKNNEPDVYSKTYKFLVPTGYIVQKLTDEFTIDPSRASTTMLFNINSREWSDDLIHELNIDKNKLPEVLPSDKIAGYITKEAAKNTGLKKGTPVVTGCMDTVAAALGSKITKHGDVFAILGTVGRLGVCLDKPIFDKRFINCCYGIEDKWLSMAAINGAGSSYRWFKNNFAHFESIKANNDFDPYEVLNHKANKSPPGSKGLIYLPYISAERSPIWSSSAKGAFLGINNTHKKKDFIRALLEGICYAFKHNKEVFINKLNIDFDNLVITGGGAKSNLWRQILSDILNLKILLPSIIETETLGVAYIAGKAVKLNNNFLQQKIEETIIPNYNNNQIYTEIYNIYKDLHVVLKKTNKKIHHVQTTYY